MYKAKKGLQSDRTNPYPLRDMYLFAKISVSQCPRIVDKTGCQISYSSDLIPCAVLRTLVHLHSGVSEWIRSL